MDIFLQNLRTIVKFLVLLVVVVLVNAYVQQAGVQWDMTEARIYSLAQRSVETTRAVKSPVTIYFFHTEQARSRVDATRLRRLLQQYDNLSENVTFREINHSRNPGLARQYGVRSNNTIVLASEGRSQKVATVDMYEFAGRRGRQRRFRAEKALTTALVKLTQSTDRAVYFTRGHGEYKRQQARSRSVSAFANAVSEEGYTVKTLNPLIDDLPDTRDLLVVVQPRRPFSQKLVDSINQWNRRGGHLLVAAGPSIGPQLSPLVEPRGIRFESNQIIDKQRRVQSLQSLVNPFLFAPIFDDHPTVNDIQEQGLTLRMGRASSLALSHTGSDTASTILRTSPEAYAKPLNLPEDASLMSFNPETDQRGPFSVAAAYSGDTAGKVVAVANADILANGLFSRAPGNRNFGLNLVNWIFDRQVSLGIRATPTNYNSVTVTQRQAYVLQVVALFVIPGFIILWGGWVWWKRKNR